MKKSLIIYLFSILLFTAFAKSNNLILDEGRLFAPVSLNYQWKYDGALLSETGNTLSVSKSGTYEVEMTNIAGVKTTAKISVKVAQDGHVYRIWTIGDSTMQTYEPFWKPRQGWGAVFQHFFDTAHVEVINRSAGGTSSKSFYEISDLWPQLVTQLQEGDYVIIQFGINDRYGSDPDRYTDPNGGSDQEGSTKYFLKKYVDESIAKGAYPILATTIRRNQWSGTSNVDGYGAYAQAARQLAAELDVPLLDIDSLGKISMEEAGQAYTTPYWYMSFDAGVYPYPWEDGQADVIHIQEMGAIEVAKQATAALKLNAEDSMMNLLINHLKPWYQLTTASNYPDDVQITQSDSFPEGVNITMRAFYDPNTHIFDGWFDGIVTDGEVEYSDQPRYEFTMPPGDIKLDAILDTDFSKLDCNGEYEGTASVDPCGACAEGSTGIVSCYSGFDTSITFNIKSSNSGMCMTAEDLIAQRDCIGSKSQAWQLIEIGDNNYKIKNDSSGLFIENTGSFLKLGETGVDWRFEEADSGAYRIVQKDNISINFAVSRATPGTRVLLAIRKDDPGHMFYIEPAMDPLAAGEELEMLMIYPNPVHENTVSLQVASGVVDPNLQILSLDGKILRTETLKVGTNQIELNGLSNGLFLVNLLDGEAIIYKSKLLIK